MKFMVVFVALAGVCAVSGQLNYPRQPHNPFADNRPTYNPFADNRPTYNRNGGQERYANIIKSNFDLSPDGVYQYNYQTDNGITAEQSGYPRALGGVPPEVAETVQGGFSWTSPEGKFISIGYVADENGYRPVGDAIPTPPPIPHYILRSIEYNKLKAAQPQRKFF